MGLCSRDAKRLNPPLKAKAQTTRVTDSKEWVQQDNTEVVRELSTLQTEFMNR